jgi:hypothetical protein
LLFVAFVWLSKKRKTRSTGQRQRKESSVINHLLIICHLSSISTDGLVCYTSPLRPFCVRSTVYYVMYRPDRAHCGVVDIVHHWEIVRGLMDSIQNFIGIDSSIINPLL